MPPIFRHPSPVSAASAPEPELDLEPEPEPPLPGPISVSRSGRVRKIRNLQDFLPTSYAGPCTPRLAPLATAPHDSSRGPSPNELLQEAGDALLAASALPVNTEPALPDQISPSASGIVDDPAYGLETQSAPSSDYRSSTDIFGMYRVFPVRPKRDPEESDKSLESHCDPVSFDMRVSGGACQRAPPGHEGNFADDAARLPHSPFPNATTFDILYWQNNGSTTKSDQQLNILARVMQEPDFKPADLAHFDAARALKILDNYTEDESGSPLSAKDGWLQGEVSVRVPKEGVRYTSEAAAPLFTLKDVWHRSIVEVLRSALQQECVRDWHMIPHRLYITSMHSDLSDDTQKSPRASLSQSSGESQTTDSSSSSCSSSDESFDSEDDIRALSEIFNSDVALEEDANM